MGCGSSVPVVIRQNDAKIDTLIVPAQCSDSDFKSVISSEKVAALTSIEIGEPDIDSPITASSLGLLASKLPNLTSLSFTFGPYATDEIFAAISKNTKLTRLTAKNGFDMEAAGLANVAKLSNLEVLEFFDCVGLNDDGFVAAITGLTKLRRVGLKHCSGVGAKSVGALFAASEKRDGLTSFTAPLCIGIYNDALELMAASPYIKNIKELDFSEINPIDEEGLSKLAPAATGLVSLKLDRCARIGDDALEALSKLGPQFAELSIAECPVTEEGKKKLKTALPNLVIRTA
jgi:hypothetical protein